MAGKETRHVRFPSQVLITLCTRHIIITMQTANHRLATGRTYPPTHYPSLTGVGLRSRPALYNTSVPSNNTYTPYNLRYCFVRLEYSLRFQVVQKIAHIERRKIHRTLQPKHMNIWAYSVGLFVELKILIIYSVTLIVIIHESSLYQSIM